MAVPVIETGHTTDISPSGTDDLSFTKPSGLVSGDLCIIVAWNDVFNSETDEYNSGDNRPFDSSATPDQPFTFINESGAGGLTDSHSGAFYKVIDDTETWPYTLDDVSSETTTESCGVCFRVTGVDTSTPIHIVGTDYNGDNSNAHVIPELTTTLNDCLIIAVHGFDGGDGHTFSTSSTGWAILQSLTQDVGQGNGSCGAVAEKDLASFGVSGDITFDAQVSDGGTGFQFAIAPVAVAGGGLFMSQRLLNGLGVGGPFFFNPLG